MEPPLLFYWCLGASVLDFALMGFDKRQAKRGGRRVPERRFFLVALLGGTAGAILGMHAFHHKTLHRHFRFGIPAILLLQILIPFGLWLYFAVIR